MTDFEGKQVFAGGENSVAVFAIDQTSDATTQKQQFWAGMVTLA